MSLEQHFSCEFMRIPHSNDTFLIKYSSKTYYYLTTHFIGDTSDAAANAIFCSQLPKCWTSRTSRYSGALGKGDRTRRSRVDGTECITQIMELPVDLGTRTQ